METESVHPVQELTGKVIIWILGFLNFQPIEMHSTARQRFFVINQKFGKPLPLQCSQIIYYLGD